MSSLDAILPLLSDYTFLGLTRTKELVKKHLEEHGCNGLRNKDWGCYCGIDNLIPCYKLWWSKAMSGCQTTRGEP